MAADRVNIPGSTVPRTAAAQPLPPADPSTRLEVTMVLSRPAGGAPAGASREQVEHALAASPAHLQAVLEFARASGLQVIEQSAARRMVRVAGTVAQFEKAFEAHLKVETEPAGPSHLTYNGPLTVPSSLDGVVTAVLGLDQRPIAKPRESPVP